MNSLSVLISQLSRDEKKYFRKFGYLQRSGEGKSGLKLFDSLDRYPAADDDSLKIRLRKESFVRYFAVVKYQLYQRLLHVLCDYHADDQPEIKIQRYMEQSRILQIHNMDEESIEYLNKARELSVMNDSLYKELECLNALQRHYTNRELGEQNLGALKQLIQDRALTLRKLNIQESMDQLYSNQMLLMKSALHSRSKQVIEEHERIFNMELVQIPNPEESLQTSYTRFCIRLHYYMLQNRPDLQLKESEAAIQWIEANPLMLKKNFSACLWIYMQAVHASFYTQKLEYFEKSLLKLKNLAAQSEFDRIALFMYYCPFALHLYSVNKESNNLKTLLAEATGNMKEWGSKIRVDVRLAISVSMVSAWVEMGEYEQALNCIDDYLDNYNSGIRIDALLMLYFYQLICHFELRHTEYVRNVLPNVYRYLLRNSYKGPLEDALLTFFKSLLSSKDAEQQLEIFQSLKARILKIQESSELEQQHQGLVPIVLSYIESKIAGRPYHQFMFEAH